MLALDGGIRERMLDIREQNKHSLSSIGSNNTAD